MVRSHDRTELVTADDNGMIKQFRYPCIEEGSKYHEYRGHSSHVTNISYSRSDEYIVSAGGNDRCLFQFVARRAS